MAVENRYAGLGQLLRQHAAPRQCEDLDLPSAPFQLPGEQDKLAFRTAEIQRPDDEENGPPAPASGTGITASESLGRRAEPRGVAHVIADLRCSGGRASRAWLCARPRRCRPAPMARAARPRMMASSGGSHFSRSNLAS